MAEKNNEIHEVTSLGEESADLAVRLDKVQVAGRLRQAIRAVGTQADVAELSGVPIGTLNNYLGGRYDMRLGTLLALAAACKVSLDWLATGIGPRNPEWQVPAMSGPPVGTDLPGGGWVGQGPVMPLPQRAGRKAGGLDDPHRVMFTESNVTELSGALTAALKIARERGAKLDERTLVQLMLIIRDGEYKSRHGSE